MNDGNKGYFPKMYELFAIKYNYENGTVAELFKDFITSHSEVYIFIAMET
jgi:hypothetical protein